MKKRMYALFLFPAVPFLLAAACSGGNQGGEPTPTDHPVEYSGKVETYRYSPAARPSTFFTVSVNGESQFVYPTPEPQLAIFGCEGEVTVEIRALKERIERVSVRPLSKNYTHTITGNVITFTMEPLDRIAVEINGDETNPLFLFANPIEAPEEKPAPDDPEVVYFEAGKIHTVPSITISSGRKLYVEGGAIVNTDGTVTINSTEGVEISGGGIINSTGSGTALSSYRNRDIKFSNVTLLNKDGWSLACVESSDVEFDNFKLIATASSNSQGHENGGINLVGCRDVKHRHCLTYAWDDTYCIKSQKWNWAGEVSNISYEDCIAWNVKSGNGFEIGYELNLPVSNVSYKDIYILHSGGRETEFRRGAISIHNGTGGKVSNVSYENVFIEDPKEYGIHMQILKSSYDIGTGVTWAPGYIEGVTLRNVRMYKQAPKGNFIKGYDADHTVKDITFDGLYIDGERITDAADGGFQISHSNPSFQ